MRPSHDPNSTKYPGRTFWGGHWCTPEQIAAHKARKLSERGREQNRRYGVTEKARVRKRALERKKRGSDIPLDAPPLSRFESGRRAGLASGSKALDAAIARYEGQLEEIHQRSPHLKETTLA